LSFGNGNAHPIKLLTSSVYVRNHVAAVRELANESQRDSITQPRVTKLPWVKVKKPHNPKGVASLATNTNGIPCVYVRNHVAAVRELANESQRDSVT